MVIALHNKIIKEEYTLLGLLVAIVIGMNLVFSNGTYTAVTRSVVAFFWLFVIPGYAIMFYWREKLGLGERVVIGTVAAMALISILSYYLGLLGLHVRFHGWVLPIVFIGGGFFLAFKKRRPIVETKTHKDNESNKDREPERPEDSTSEEHTSGEKT